MNSRRSFAVQVGGVVSLGVGTRVLTQEQPETTPVGRDLLQRYFDDVIGARDFEAIYELFSADAFDLSDMYWQHVEDFAQMQGEGIFPVPQLYLLTGDDSAAIAYGTRSTVSGRVEFFCAIRVEDKRIAWLRSMDETIA